MQTNRVARWLALLAVASTAAGLTGGGAVAASSPTAPAHGLYLTGEAQFSSAEPLSTYVVSYQEKQEHLITVTPSAAHPGDGVVTVYSRSTVAKRPWGAFVNPTLIVGLTSAHIDTYTDASGGTVEIVITTCDGVYEANNHAALVNVQPTTSCTTGPVPTASTETLSGFIPTPTSDESEFALGVLVPDQTTPGTWDLLDSTDGGSPVLATLPTADHFVPATLATTAADHELQYAPTVIGYGINSVGNEGIFETRLTWKNAMPVWTAPKEIATLDKKNADYTIESAVQSLHTYVGLYLPPGTIASQSHTLFLDRGPTLNADGSGTQTWSGAQAIANTTLRDSILILTLSQDLDGETPNNGRLHATYRRSISNPTSARTTKSGVMTTHLANNSWATPRFLSHWYKDQPIAASIDSTNTLHVEYQRH
jgi:hypothetical protein